MRKHLLVVGLLTLLVPLILVSIPGMHNTQAQESGGSHKISGLLGLQVQAKLNAQARGPQEEGQVDSLQAMQAMGMEVTDLNKQRIFIHLSQEPSQSQISDLESMGITLYLDSWIPPLKNHPTGFILADMPIDKLNTLAEKGYIVSLETAEQMLHPQNDLGVAEIDADDVWGLGYDGTGVKIAVLDSGFQVGCAGHAAKHGDFPTMTAGDDYKDYSAYPTLDDDIANAVTGHGTHVAGSVLGRGTQSSLVYRGSAPDATPIFLKIGNDTNGNASNNAMVYALRAAVDTYNADVITMSYGGWSTYHDGSDETCQAVDYAVSEGAVVFISAGNDADDDQHYSGTVSASSTTDFIQLNVSGAGLNNTALRFNLVWYDGTGTNNDLELKYYDSSQNLLASTNGAQSESSRGTESEISYYNAYLPVGSYSCYLKVQNNSSNSQFFHLYYSSALNLAGAGSVKFNSPDANYTIGAPAEADSAIAVGAYTTRKVWYDYANNGWQYTNETVDLISTFSSRGPRVDTGAPPKPNIVAPGCGIISCRDSDVYTWPGGANAFYIDNDGPNENSATKNNGSGPADYYVMQGTSMACPIAAGVGALLLEKNPTWTPAQVRHALEFTATDKGDTGQDNTYGWGLIDALDAVNSSLPTWESYSDSGHTTQTDTFSGATNHDYQHGEGFASGTIKVGYYDGGGTLRETDTYTGFAGGTLSSQCHFPDYVGVATAGTWHAVTVRQADSLPSTYAAAILDAQYLINDDFTVEASAIPEFPTVLVAIVSLSLCGGIYLWFRRRTAAVRA